MVQLQAVLPVLMVLLVPLEGQACKVAKVIVIAVFVHAVIIRELVEALEELLVEQVLVLIPA